MTTKAIQGSIRIDLGKNNIFSDDDVALTIVISRASQGVARVEMNRNMVAQILTELRQTRLGDNPVALKQILKKKKISLVIEDYIF